MLEPIFGRVPARDLDRVAAVEAGVVERHRRPGVAEDARGGGRRGAAGERAEEACEAARERDDAGAAALAAADGDGAPARVDVGVPNADGLAEAGAGGEEEADEDRRVAVEEPEGAAEVGERDGARRAEAAPAREADVAGVEAARGGEVEEDGDGAA